MKHLIIVGVCAIFIGLIGGYGIGYAHFVPITNEWIARSSELSNEVTDLTAKNKQLTDETVRLDSTVTSQSNKIMGLEYENLKLQTDLVTAEGSINSYKLQVSSLTTQASDLKTESAILQTRLDNVLGISVIQHYDWLNAYSWELTIPLSLYVEYKERDRPSTVSGYVELAKDKQDDSFIDQIVQLVETKSRQYSFTERQKIMFAVTFVQSLPYTDDIVTAQADEYPRYPVETLFDRGGDCEDTAILAAAILDRLGYDVALISPPKHMAVGIVFPGAYGRYYECNGKKYFYLETTGENWGIGEMPPEFTNSSANVYPLR